MYGREISIIPYVSISPVYLIGRRGRRRATSHKQKQNDLRRVLTHFALPAALPAGLLDTVQYRQEGYSTGGTGTFMFTDETTTYDEI